MYSVAISFDSEAEAQSFRRKIDAKELNEILCEPPVARMRAIAMPDQAGTGMVYSCCLTQAQEAELELTHVKLANGSWVSRKHYRIPS